MSGGVNLWRLECFVALAEELHFGRTAARLFITQPALSLQIKQLELCLGYEIVHRDRHVTLTEEGRRLLPYAEHVLAAAEVFVSAAAHRGSTASSVHASAASCGRRSRRRIHARRRSASPCTSGSAPTRFANSIVRNSDASAFSYSPPRS